MLEFKVTNIYEYCKHSSTPNNLKVEVHISCESHETNVSLNDLLELYGVVRASAGGTKPWNAKAREGRNRKRA
jgi:hypothetical protein